MNDPYNAQSFNKKIYPQVSEPQYTSPSISVSTHASSRGLSAPTPQAGFRTSKSRRTSHSQPNVVISNKVPTTAGANNLATVSSVSPDWDPGSDHYFDFLTNSGLDALGNLVNEQTGGLEELDTSPSSEDRAESAPNHNIRRTSSSGQQPSTLSSHLSSVPLAQRPVHRSALKRKADSIEPLASGSSHTKETQPLSANSDFRRTVSFDQMSSKQDTRPDDKSKSPNVQVQTQNTSDSQLRSQDRQTRQSSDTALIMQESGASDMTTSQIAENHGTKHPSGHPPSILPPEKVFPIQIGSDLFRLSGASISSDGPSYFTQFFEDQIQQNEESGGVRTLYIDRDPGTFKDIARHLQGYYVKPVDGTHFVKLFADAQFYSLPRLIDQLFESEIFIQIGERHFQIPKDIFSEPGNSPNFFSLGFAVFFSTPRDVFPGLDKRGLLRPPSITPPYVPGRSAETFAELLHLLRGYPLHIRNESHRAELLRDCRYFHLRGLEQKIIAHDISYNLGREKHEITLRLEDVKPSGISFTADDASAEEPPSPGWVSYARPFVDEKTYEMIIEIGGENTMLDLADMRLDFRNLAKARVSSLFQVIANKMNLPNNAPLGLIMLSGGKKAQGASPGHTPLSEDRVKVRFDAAADIFLNGEPYEIDWDSRQGQIMARGPSVFGSESDAESDILSESASSKTGSQPTSGVQQRRQSTQQNPGKASHQMRRDSLAVPQTQTGSSTGPVTKKRKRQDSQEPLGQWIIKTGQWRLRVQPTPNDATPSSFEIVFVGVKVDAFTNEKARNARKAFLS